MGSRFSHFLHLKCGGKCVALGVVCRIGNHEEGTYRRTQDQKLKMEEGRRLGRREGVSRGRSWVLSAYL
jgi:hypothetical protein